MPCGYVIVVMPTGFRYGKSLIPISSADDEAMKVKAEKCLSVLGFTKMEQVITGNSVCCVS